jgi:hypothetical protein
VNILRNYPSRPIIKTATKILVGYKLISQEKDKLEDFISAGDEIAC